VRIDVRKEGQEGKMGRAAVSLLGGEWRRERRDSEWRWKGGERKHGKRKPWNWETTSFGCCEGSVNMREGRELVGKTGGASAIGAMM
jgi:hypothetical protein